MNKQDHLVAAMARSFDAGETQIGTVVRLMAMFRAQGHHAMAGRLEAACNATSFNAFNVVLFY